jgi:hypothetical protein
MGHKTFNAGADIDVALWVGLVHIAGNQQILVKVVPGGCARLLPIILVDGHQLTDDAPCLLKLLTGFVKTNLIFDRHCSLRSSCVERDLEALPDAITLDAAGSL